MLSLRLLPPRLHWHRISFSSTLYLHPVLDVLLTSVPEALHPEIRLGLQEALVNAATHGNALNPHKSITVEYCRSPQGYCWIITDQGEGFDRPCFFDGSPLDCPDCLSQWFPPDEATHGRGLGILLQVFDQVHWNEDGTQLRLSKRLWSPSRRSPLPRLRVIKARFFSKLKAS